MIMIVWLLIGLNSLYCQNDSIPFKGEFIQDTVKTVLIPINYIKLANYKLIEYKNLKHINSIQDSIIILKNRYIEEQHNIIVEFQNKLQQENQEVYRLKERIEKNRKKNNIIKYGGIGLIIGLTTIVICK